jgi:hypothetical protein
MSVYKKFTAQDYAIVPFNAHKQYDFTSASAASNSINYFNTQWTSESIDLYTSGNIKYSQLDHLFYKNFKRDISNRLGNFNYTYQKRTLYKQANTLSIPTGLYGHEIKPGTLYISSSNYEITDDSRGNLIISGTNIDNYSTNFRANVLNIGPVNGFKRYDLNTLDGYLTFNGYESSVFYKDGKPRVNQLSSYSTPNFGDEFDDSYYFNLIRYKNVNFSEKTLFNGNFPGIDFNGTDSEIKLAHNEKFNFNPGDDFTITLQANISHSSNETSYLISKSTTKTTIASPNEGTAGRYTTQTTGALQPKDTFAEPQFPFEVYAIGNNIYFSRSDGNITTTINGTFTLETITHFTCRVQDGTMAIFKNGISLTSGADNTVNQTQNQANIYIGNKGGNSKFLSGSLSQIKVYEEALSDTQILNHYSSSNGSPYIGNVFYQNGFVTITHPNYISALDTTGDGIINTLQFQGSHLIYENEYQCTVDEHEFNDTLNISARKIKSNQSQDLADFATGSLFKPYVTTIGLYNEDNELLVVGKLGQPIRTSNETDTTFIVRWDT